jgi:hypothetical protein
LHKSVFVGKNDGDELQRSNRVEGSGHRTKAFL